MKTKYGHVAFAGLLSVVAGCGGGTSSTPGTGGSSVGGNSGSGFGGSGGGAPGGGGGSAPAGSVGSAGSGPAGAGGTTIGPGGQSGSSAGAGPAGSGGSAAGAGGRGGSAGSAAGTGGGAAGRGGASGSGPAGSGGGGTSARYTCPAGPFTAPFPLSATPTKVAGVPPSDSFNENGNGFTIVEGPVWFEGALYVSEIGQMSAGGYPARILKVTEANAVSIATGDLGTNGLAVDNMGRLIGASHKTGGVVAVNLGAMTATPIIQMYDGKRFNTPNDLVVRSDGTIYFTDPTYQAPSPAPQTQARVYRFSPGATAAAVVDATLGQPNGITLSLDEMFLYVADGGGRYRFPVNADGSVGTRTTFPTTGGGSDGMGIDCQGNLYYTTNNTVQVFSPTTGMMLGTITVSGVQSVTNVAFGGADHRTLYITGLGSGSQKGLFRVTMPLPGMPY